MTDATYDATSGSETRDARQVMEPLLVFSLLDEIRRLREEPPWIEGDRNARTLAKETDFRVLLTVLRPGAMLSEVDGDGRVSIHVLDGSLELRLDDGQQQLSAGQLAAVNAGTPWNLVAVSDAAVLVTFAWPESKAFV